MRRLLFSLMLTFVLMPMAQGADKVISSTDSTSIPLQKLKPTELRALELDKLFGQLHADGAERRAAAVEAKIWATWGRNDSVSAEVLLAQASAAMNAQELPVAEDILNTLISTNPSYSEALNRRATLHFMAKRYEKSLADIEQVLNLEPRHFGALTGRGMIFEAQEKFIEALAAYREALTVNPHLAAVRENIKRLEKERPEI